VGHTEIVGVHDQKFRVARVAEPPSECFGWFLTAGYNGK
jgi:hypothetical protein